MSRSVYDFFHQNAAILEYLDAVIYYMLNIVWTALTPTMCRYLLDWLYHSISNQCDAWASCCSLTRCHGHVLWQQLNLFTLRRPKHWKLSPTWPRPSPADSLHPVRCTWHGLLSGFSKVSFYCLSILCRNVHFNTVNRHYMGVITANASAHDQYVSANLYRRIWGGIHSIFCY